MKGQPEQGQDIGLGKKLEPRPVISPDWKPRPDLGPHIWQHRDGKLKNAQPDPPPEPEPVTPYKPDPILDWYRRQGLMCDSF